MNTGDEVAHRKHGRGVIQGFKNLGARGRFASVLFSDQEEPRHIKEQRLRAIPKVKPIDDTRPRPAPPKRRDRSINYLLLEQAERDMRKEFPDADDVRAFPYSNHAVVEIWKDGGAKVIRYTRRTSAT